MSCGKATGFAGPGSSRKDESFLRLQTSPYSVLSRVGREWRDVKDRLERQGEPAIAPRLRTLVVEDSPVAMRALANLLEMHPLIECVGTARDGHEGLKLVAQHEPDLVERLERTLRAFVTATCEPGQLQSPSITESLKADS